MKDPVIRRVLKDLDARLVEVIDDRLSPYALLRQLMADDRLPQHAMWTNKRSLKFDREIKGLIGGVVFDSDGNVFVIRRQDG